MLTKRERQILTIMVETDDYLIQDGREVWVGNQRTSSKLVMSLLRQCFLRQDSMSPGVYYINESAKRALKGKDPYACANGHYHDSIWSVMACGEKTGEK